MLIRQMFQVRPNGRAIEDQRRTEERERMTVVTPKKPT